MTVEPVALARALSMSNLSQGEIERKVPLGKGQLSRMLSPGGRTGSRLTLEQWHALAALLGWPLAALLADGTKPRRGKWVRQLARESDPK